MSPPPGTLAWECKRLGIAFAKVLREIMRALRLVR